MGRGGKRGARSGESLVSDYKPKALVKYHARVAALGCLITQRPAQVCHVIGKPSVSERILEPKPHGKKFMRHGWLVIPLHPDLHWLLDNRSEEFEATYGPVADMVDQVAALAAPGRDVWKLSQIGRK